MNRRFRPRLSIVGLWLHFLILGRGCFISLWRLVRPSQDGEHAERPVNTLFGAKDGGQHRQERTLALTSLRCTRRRRALATRSYDNMVRGPKFGA